MRRGLRTGTWLLFLSSFLLAQEPAFRESVTVRLLEVDVRVVDREGNPVYGLTADDFELFENGAPKEITNFSEIRETRVELARGGESAQPEEATPRARAPRTVVFFFDSLPWRGPARANMFDQLRELIPRLIREGDRAMVYVWAASGAKPVVSLTSDHEALATALSALERGGAIASDGVSIGEQAAWFSEVAEAAEGFDAEAALETSIRNIREEALARMRRKMASLERIIGGLTSLPKERKSSFTCRMSFRSMPERNWCSGGGRPLSRPRRSRSGPSTPPSR
jgi:VWFA-related protein